MNPLEWIVEGTAELVVAYREDWMLNQLSRRAWITLGIYFSMPFLIVALVTG